MNTIIKSALHKIGIDVRKRRNCPEYSLLGIRQMPIETILDIGANTGQFARDIRKHFPEAAIVCFEPLPDAHRNLKSWADGDGRALALNCALGDEEGTVSMYRHTEHSVSSSLLSTTKEGEALYPKTIAQESIEVAVRRLDEIPEVSSGRLRGDVLVKIDVQGYEDRVICGGRATIGAAKACIVELNVAHLYDGQCGIYSLMGLFDELGFSYAGNLTQVCSPTDGRVVYVDAVFFSRSM